MSGFAENSRYDYQGNLITSVRQLAADYHQAVNWTPIASLTVPVQLDAAAAAAGLVPVGDGGRDTFTGQRRGQRAEPARPDRHAAQPGDEIRRRPARLCRGGPAQPGEHLAPAGRHARRPAGPGHRRPARGRRDRATRSRGQRVSISYGNGTGRRMPTTRRPSGWPSSSPPGPGSSPPPSRRSRTWPTASTRPGTSPSITDNADTQDVIFFRNQRVEPSAGYTYDPLYRLIAATGRERLGQTGSALSPPPGHQRRLVPDEPAAARRRERDGHLHRDLQLRPPRQHPGHGPPGRQPRAGPGATATPKPRRSPPPRPATG